MFQVHNYVHIAVIWEENRMDDSHVLYFMCHLRVLRTSTIKYPLIYKWDITIGLRDRFGV